MTFTGVPGGWFGEGTATMKREPYRYNIQALPAKSVVAGLPVTFHWLLDHSIAFNRFVMHQLNERLGHVHCRAQRLIASTTPTCAWPADLASCSSPVLYPVWAGAAHHPAGVGLHLVGAVAPAGQ